MSRACSIPGPLSGNPRFVAGTNDRCTTPCKRGWEGLMHAPLTSGVHMRPCVRAIQASTGLVHRVQHDVVSSIRNSHRIRESPPGLTTTTWLLCHLVDSSARMPTKDVPSCDKPEGAARRLRTQDLRMGIPTAIASRNGERPELKHLSRGRKRKQTAMSLVTASERDTVQTEAFGQCGVWTDIHHPNGSVKSPGMERETG
jgi:hypothetical protein